LVVVFDGDEDSVEKDKNDDEPIERLTLHQTTNFYSASNVKLVISNRVCVQN